MVPVCHFFPIPVAAFPQIDRLRGDEVCSHRLAGDFLARVADLSDRGGGVHLLCVVRPPRWAASSFRGCVCAGSTGDALDIRCNAEFKGAHFGDYTLGLLLDYLSAALGRRAPGSPATSGLDQVQPHGEGPCARGCRAHCTVRASIHSTPSYLFVAPEPTVVGGGGIIFHVSARYFQSAPSCTTTLI